MTRLNKAKHEPKANVSMNEFKGPESVGYERIIVFHNALKGKCILLVIFAKQVKGNEN